MDVSYPSELCSGTVFRLRNLYSRSTQNTDIVSSINFSTGVSYLIIMSHKSLGINNNSRDDSVTVEHYTSPSDFGNIIHSQCYYDPVQ